MRKQDRVFSLDDTEIARSWDTSKSDKTKEEIIAIFEKYASKKACVKVEYLDYESTIGYKAKFKDDKSLSIIIGRNYIDNNMPYISRLDSSKKAKDIINKKRNVMLTSVALVGILSVGSIVLTKNPIKSKIGEAIDIMIEKDNEKFKEEQHVEEISNLLNQNNRVIWIDDSEDFEAQKQLNNIENKQEEQLLNEQEEQQQLLNEDFNNQFNEYNKKTR